MFKFCNLRFFPRVKFGLKVLLRVKKLHFAAQGSVFHHHAWMAFHEDMFGSICLDENSSPRDKSWVSPFCKTASASFLLQAKHSNAIARVGGLGAKLVISWNEIPTQIRFGHLRIWNTHPIQRWPYENKPKSKLAFDLIFVNWFQCLRLALFCKIICKI